METAFTKARRLRREMSPTERIVWRVLRGRGLQGFKFRRQVPVGPFIVDFLCVEAGLIVEIDGQSHDARLAYDRRRTAYLENQGYRVIRLTNDQIREDLEAAMRFIYNALPDHPLHPRLRGDRL